MKQAIFSKKGAKVVGPYSPAIKFGNLLFISGQIGKNPKTDKLGNDIKEQTEWIFKNILSILEIEGLTLDDVLKTNVYLANMNDYQVMNEIYAKHFKEPFPARATVAVAKLPAGALVEIEVLAGLKGSSENEDCCGGGCGGDCEDC